MSSGAILSKDVGPAAQNESAGAPVTLPRGSSIGRYIVLGLVGRGGMGEVYAAYDPELDRKVAVKLLRVKPGNGVSLSEGRQRTLREAQAIARLSHPNIVVVFDVGTFEDKVFIAMEFVEGSTITFWVQAETRSWREVLKVFIEAGKGLHAAHEKGLVHRDFKPDNVMVGRDGSVRVMDFGLARAADANKNTSGDASGSGGEAGASGSGDGEGQAAASGGASGDGEKKRDSTERLKVVVSEAAAPLASVSTTPIDSSATMVLNSPQSGVPVEIADSGGRANSTVFDVRLTRTGAMMGTPAYMSPEQFLGRATDGRSDQFSFCVALYESIYGARPFAGNNLAALSASVVQGAVAEAPPKSKIPLWLRKVLLRGMRPKPTDRWPSMAALVEALEKDPRVARRRWAVAGAVACIAGAVSFGVYHRIATRNAMCLAGPAKLAGVWEIPTAGAPPPSTFESVRKAFLSTGKSYAPDVFRTVSGALTSYAERWVDMYRESCEATHVHGDQSADVLDLRMECLQERLGGLRSLTNVFVDATGEVVENAVNATNNLSSLDRCADVPLLRAVVRPPEDAATRVHVDRIRKKLGDLKARFDSGRFKEAHTAMPTIIAEARSTDYQPLVAEALALSGVISEKVESAEAAAEQLGEAYLLADASRHDEVRAESAALLVYVEGYQRNRFQEARRWADTAEAVLQRLGGHDLLRAWLYNDLGTAYYANGQKDEAIQMFRRALAVKQAVLGPDHPDVGLSEGNIAISLAEMGRNQEALAHNERALETVTRGLGAAHPTLALQLINLGEILCSLGRYGEARNAFLRARAIAEHELSPDSNSVAELLTGIGISYLGESNPTSALPPLQQAFGIVRNAKAYPIQRSETSFALAQALWGAKRDLVHARTLAEDARAGFLKVAAKGRADAVSEWLNQHSRS